MDEFIEPEPLTGYGCMTGVDLSYILGDHVDFKPMEDWRELDMVKVIEDGIEMIRVMEDKLRPIYCNPDDVDDAMQRLAYSYGVKLVCDDVVPRGKAFLIPEPEDEDE